MMKINNRNILQACAIILLMVTHLSCTDYSKQGLFNAIDQDNVKTVERIITKVGVDSCLYNGELNPLLYAIVAESDQVAKFLIPHSDLSFTDKDKNNALSYAIMKSRSDIVKLLLQEGMDPNYRNQHTGYLPIHYASDQSDVTVTNLLLQHGAGIDSLFSGATALHLAIMHHNNDQALFLLQKGASIELPTINDWDIMQLTVANNNVEILDYLVQHHDVTISDEIFREVCYEGDTTTVNYILQNKLVEHDKITEQFAFVSDIDVCKLLLDHGASVNHVNKETGLAAIHIACINGDLPLLKLLQENGADIELKAQKGMLKNYSPLMLAAIYSEAMVSLGENLQSLGSEISSEYTETTGRSPNKTVESSLSMVKQLVEWGANVNYKAKDKTAITIAHECNNDEVKAYLSEKI